MTKVDCIVELANEKVEGGMMKAAKNLLINGFSAEFVSEILICLSKIEILEKEIKSSN